MKNIIKKISWWLVLPFFCLVVLIGCKSREKQVQKSEAQSEKKTEATYKIEDKTFEIVADKVETDFVRTNFVQNQEGAKDETNNVEIIREYYENGNLKSEINKSFSQLSEATKYAINEMSEKLTKVEESSKYWEESSNHYYSLWEQEKAKLKTKEMQLKAKPTFTWQWFISGILIGWLALPNVWRWFKSCLLRFNPYLRFLEWLKK